MAVDLVANAENVLTGMFMARAIYGAEYIAPAFWVNGDNDAEKADDYRGYIESQGDWQVLDASDLATFNSRGGDAGFTANGLYDARVYAPATSSFDAQGLLAVKDGDTLVLTFRGTDGEDPAVVSGQAFSGVGMAAHYKAFKPLINAAYDYLKNHPEITDVIISGHSLGGAMVDVFTLVDAARFRDLRPDGLTIVSVASSGVPKDLGDFLGGIDATAATIVDKVITDVFGVEFVHHVIKSLNLPDDYISISNSDDRAHFPNNFPDVPEDFGLVPIVALKDNLQFGADTLFHLPNIGNSDVQYEDVFAHPFDFRGMGAEHNSALLWTNLQGLVTDALFQFYSGQDLIAGVTDYNHVPDLNGQPVALFAGFLKLNSPSFMNDQGERTLFGKVTADYILGMAGDDWEEGRGGADLLSGGLGDDRLLGGNGSDHLSGGFGTDLMKGGAGRDTFHYSDVRQSMPGDRADAIHGFEAGFDKIDVSPIDAEGGKVGRQAFEFIGTDGFTAEGQVRAIQIGSDTLLRFNTQGSGGAEMEILLTNINASTLTSDSFIL
jgi:Ca2+-binding RTX toxin-like protein